jgi:hypothetical protein
MCARSRPSSCRRPRRQQPTCARCPPVRSRRWLAGVPGAGSLCTTRRLLAWGRLIVQVGLARQRWGEVTVRVPNAPMAALHGAPRCCWLHAAMHAMPAIALAAMMAAAGIHRPMRGGPVSERMHVNGVQLCVRLYSRTRCSYGCTRTHCSCCLQGARLLQAADSLLRAEARAAEKPLAEGRARHM